MNRDTALTQQQINMVNQVGPDGSLTYTPSGSSSFVDSSGKTVSTPTYTATTTLSPQQQAIKDQTDAASLNLGKLANTQSSFLNDYLSKPFEYTNKDTENFAYDLGKQRLDPRFAQQEDAMRTQLINSGIRPGTPAYDQAMTQQTQGKNDAYNQLTLSSQQQGYNQALTSRNQPLNEISALMSGSQISQPNFVNTPTSNVGGVDYTGLVQNDYNQKVANQQAQMGGLFGLLGTGLTAGIKYSDRRLKKDIRRIGEKKGLPWYTFHYIWDADEDDMHEGFMSDDIRNARPEAVMVDESGFDRVNYHLLLEAA